MFIGWVPYTLPWGFSADKPWDLFSRRGGRGLSKRRNLFANILFGRLHGRNVSRHLLMLVRKLLNVTPKDGEIVYYSLELLL
jgi:hypothetical protein